MWKRKMNVGHNAIPCLHHLLSNAKINLNVEVINAAIIKTTIINEQSCSDSCSAQCFSTKP